MKNFFRRIGNGLRRFMYGRNGNDRLCDILMWVYLIFWLAMAVTSLFDLRIISACLGAISLVAFGYYLFRFFSRNVVKRRQEVDRFFGYFRNRKNRFRDRKTHVYKKCPHCKAMLRLPKKRGKHTVCCPACRERFSLTIRCGKRG